MDCRTIQRFLSAYLDGEMAPARRDAFFDHLAECDACRDLVGEAAWLESALAGAMKRPMTAPASIRYNVLNAIRRDSARRAPAHRGLAWRPAAAMAAVLALGSAGWRTFTNAFQPAPPAQAQTGPAPRRVAALPVPPAVERPTPKAARVSAPKPPAHPAPAVSAPAPSAPAPSAPAPSAPVPRVETPAVSRPAPPPAARSVRDAIKPPAAPPPAADGPVGTVTAISGPPDAAIARFLARREDKSGWEEATRALHARTHLQSGDETIVTMTLNDGTVLKSNQHTEFVVLRSPGKDDPAWGIRLVRGELWVKTHTPVSVATPSLRVDGEDAEFSVRSMDGEDAAAMVVEGAATARNDLGSVTLAAGEATSAPSGGAPENAFLFANPRVQLDWAYGQAPAE